MAVYGPIMFDGVDDVDDEVEVPVEDLLVTVVEVLVKDVSVEIVVLVAEIEVEIARLSQNHAEKSVIGFGLYLLWEELEEDTGADWLYLVIS